MKFLLILLLVLNWIGYDLIDAQSIKFNPLLFFTNSVDAWSSQINSSRESTCLQMCGNLASKFKINPPTLPPFFFNVHWQHKNSVNCSSEVRRLKPLCHGWYNLLDIVQIGGFQYLFPLDKQLKYHDAQKYCRSRGLDLVTLKNQTHEGFVFSSYLKYYANISGVNLTAQSRLVFWEGRAEKISDRVASMTCPSFSIASNQSDLRGLIASRSSDNCGSLNRFFCEVPTVCYRDICRANFISRFKVTPAPAPNPMATTPKVAIANQPQFVCEQCHLNHSIMFTSACPDLECPACPSNTIFDGKRGRLCNRKYFFFLDTKVNFYDAATACCNIGMQVASIMTDDDVECVKEYLSDGILRFTGDPSDTGKWMWTSGTDQGKTCQGRFSWCGNNRAVNSLPRMPFDPAAQTDSDCLALNSKIIASNEITFSLTGKGCINNMAVLCESRAAPDAPRTTSLSRTSTCKNYTNSCPSKVDISERVANQNEVNRRSGGFKSYFMCDAYYEVIIGTATFDNAEKSCEERRLELASIESYEELNCVRDLFQYVHFGGQLVQTDGIKEMEASSDRAWIKASDKACEGREISWCNSRNSISTHLLKTSSGINRCVAIDLKLSRFGLTTLPCEQQSMYLCKENTSCKYPKCPELNCSALVQVEKSSKACGSTYVVFDQPKSMKEAMETCCKMGMGLLAINSAEESVCLNKFMRASFPNLPKVWTSATDLDCRGKYAWCSTGEMLAYEGFNAFFNPPNSVSFLEVENCVSANFDTSQSTQLVREFCVAKLGFVCESVAQKFAGVVSGPVSPSLNRLFNTIVLKN
ncbi:uncharacterized protein LOC132194636 isoform X2 [Neocloeon triangulifer]|uniref:uncharacterized protein LOC132194636 isoform X2 n=1 Tax=Neocloeon triangulifer TaxID=2078957 RepID=UPI00286F337C|nr:uncharacterized protein LOC132194636 isoform X2 [Neocloeon triangulifer]